MKKRFVLTIILAFAFFGFTSDARTEANASGISFYKGTLSEALAVAKTENKFIFVDVYASWCGPCKKLKTTFKDPQVGAYFNKNFINVRIDGETEEGIKWRARYGISSYPTLLIIASDGYVKTRAEGFMKPQILINFGRRIVP